MSCYSRLDIKDIIKRALKEDIGERDITTTAIIPKNKYVKALLLAKEDCVVCGLGIAAEVFKVKDKNIRFKPLILDGQKIRKGRVIARIFGRAQSILIAERVALNFLSLLSGVATKTREYVDKVRPYKVKILDTRKTLPGLRILEKYAVRIGGGYNHRMKLDEMVMIKDNHLKALGGLRRLPRVPKGYLSEIETKNLQEFKQALKLKPDIIMLDNMQSGQIKRAVMLRKGIKPKIEVSGNVNLNNVREIAKAGPDMISVGALTHSVKAIDISLEIMWP